MTILSTIEGLLSKDIHAPPNTVLLGHLEQKAFLAASSMMGFQIELENIRTSNLVYKGLTVIPVDLPSYLAVGYILKQ